MSNKRINLLVDAVKMLIIIAIACLLVTIIVFISSDEPATALYSFFIGPFTSVRRIGNIIEGATPLMFTALAVMLIFGAGQFSMISEGAFFIGVTAAMVVAITLPLPAGIHPVVAVLCAALAGSTIAAVPALLKMKWRV
ncbi:MAG: ABC transporter permease, partial [Pseudoflavonifractor sp.]